MRSINHATTPFRYFPGKHANKITVHLNGIDHVKGEKQQTNSSEIKDNLIDPKSHLAPHWRRWLRKQMQNGESENAIQYKEDANSDKAGPKFVAAKISLPRFFRGKARSSGRLLHLPVFKADAEIPPAKWCQSQRSKRKLSLDLFCISTKIEARLEHEEDRKHERDQA